MPRRRVPLPGALKAGSGMSWDTDGLELWERDGYAEAMYEKADNDRKKERENGLKRPPAAPDGEEES